MTEHYEKMKHAKKTRNQCVVTAPSVKFARHTNTFSHLKPVICLLNVCILYEKKSRDCEVHWLGCPAMGP